MKAAVEAGRLAYRAGRIPRKMYASLSSPLAGLIRGGGARLMSVLSRLRALLKARDSVTVIEYCLIVALVAVIVIAAVSAAGPDLDRPLPTPDRPAPAAAE